MRLKTEEPKGTKSFAQLKVTFRIGIGVIRVALQFLSTSAFHLSYEVIAPYLACPTLLRMVAFSSSFAIFGSFATFEHSERNLSAAL